MKILSFFICLLSLVAFVEVNKPDGIDVSNHQGVIDWQKVSKSNIKFAYIKATEGATFTDGRFLYNSTNAQKNKIYVGAYHFFRMTSSAHDQFTNFKKAVSQINMDLVPMIDVERSDGKPTKELQDSLKVFISLIEKEYKVTPMIYGTNRSYNTYIGDKFSAYPAYIGRYGDEAPILSNKSEYTIWQYSESGKIDGISTNVDLCKLNPKNSLTDIMIMP